MVGQYFANAGANAATHTQNRQMQTKDQANKNYDLLSKRFAEGLEIMKNLRLQGASPPPDFVTMMTAAGENLNAMHSNFGVGEAIDHNNFTAQVLNTRPQVAQDAQTALEKNQVSQLSMLDQQARGIPTLEGQLAGMKAGAQKTAELGSRNPQLEGDFAAQTANAQTAGTDFAAIGRGAGQQANAQVAATDPTLAGQQQADQDFALKQRFLSNAMQFIDPRGEMPEEERQAITQEVLGMSPRKFSVTSLELAIQSMGEEFVARIERGGQPSAQELQDIGDALKLINPSSDAQAVLAQFIGQLANTGGAPAATPSVGAPNANDAARLAELERRKQASMMGQ